VHSNVIGLIAFDFVLWIVLARVMDITFVFHVFDVHPDDFAPDPAGFRIPAHMRADLEPLGQPLDHDEHPPPNNAPVTKMQKKLRSSADVPGNTLAARFGQRSISKLTGPTGVIARLKRDCTAGNKPYYDG